MNADVMHGRYNALKNKDVMPECFNRASLKIDSRYPARKQRDAKNAKRAGMTVVLFRFA